MQKILGMHLNGKNVGELIQSRLGLDDDYVQHLLKEDDWSMMILSWALVEACLNDAITRRIGNQELGEFVQNLNISGRTGKVALAQELGVIGKGEKKFIEKFSAVRNSFAHGVRRFRITFDEYFEQTGRANEFEAVLLWKELPKKGDDSISFENDKRTVILANVIAVCLTIIK